MTGTDFLKLRFFRLADFHAVFAALVVGASLRRIGGVGDIALQDNAMLLQMGIRNGDGTCKGLSVGMQAMGKQLPELILLDIILGGAIQLLIGA